MFSKGNFIRPNHPADEDRGKGVEGHESGIDCPFALDNTRIENHQSRHALQPNKGRSGHLPGIVAGVEPWWIGGHGEERN